MKQTIGECLNAKFCGGGQRLVVRCVVGVILFVAALSKVFHSTLGFDHLGAFELLHIQVEILLAAWLFSGLQSRRSCISAAMLFSAYAAVSAYHLVSGGESCGCFGRWHVDARLTLVLDVIAVPILVVTARRSPSLPLRRGAKVLGGVCIVLMGLVVTTWRALAGKSAERDQQFLSIADVASQVVVLKPESWRKRNFSLAYELSGGDRIVTGKWIVIFFRRGCSSCQDVMPEYAEAVAERHGVVKLGFIEVPSDAMSEMPHVGDFNGMLNKQKEWFITTPTAVTLDDGVVVGVWEGGAAADIPGVLHSLDSHSVRGVLER